MPLTCLVSTQQGPNGDKEAGGPRPVYERMGAALNATGRPIVFSICNWGGGAPHVRVNTDPNERCAEAAMYLVSPIPLQTWGPSVGHSWRTGRDLFAVFSMEEEARNGLPSFLQSVMGAVRGQENLWAAARPGAFNDPDMLVVGVDGMCPPSVAS